MAVLLRCPAAVPPRPSTRSSPGDVLGPQYGVTRGPEKMVLVPVRVERVGMFCMCYKSSFKRCSTLSERDFNLSRSHESQVSHSEMARSREAELPEFCYLLKKCTPVLQQMLPFKFGRSFVLTNALMLILPPRILAETCEADNSFFNMPLLFGIAMIGAAVGGLLARQRRGELKRLNEQLRQINAALRRQAKIESYAPTLSYAPVGSKLPDSEVIVDPRKEQLITTLRTGKNYLRNQAPEKAFTQFKEALELAKALGDHVEGKKAARGLGASLQRQGKYKEAIKYHLLVLDISKRAGEDSGITEAYGAIADCYTELGELEQAGKYYDKYIARLED